MLLFLLQNWPKITTVNITTCMSMTKNDNLKMENGLRHASGPFLHPSITYIFNSQTFWTLLQYGDLQLTPEVDQLPH